MCRRGWNVPRPGRWKVHIVLVKQQRKDMEANVLPARLSFRHPRRDEISPGSCPAGTGSAFNPSQFHLKSNKISDFVHLMTIILSTQSLSATRPTVYLTG